MQISFDIPSRGVGLPRSFPFRRVMPVHVTIQRRRADPQGAILFEVGNSSASNGRASIVGRHKLLETGVILVQGDAQTEPGHSGLMVLRAVLDGNLVGKSDQFSVCAHPCCVHNGPKHETIALGHIDSDDSMVGLKVWLRLASDSGEDGDLSEVQEKELVAEPHDLTGAMIKPPESANSSWQLAHQVEPDRHRIRADVMNGIDQTRLKGREGGWSNDQLDVYHCTRCGMAEADQAPIPNSGYQVTRVISTTTDGCLQLVLKKHPQGCTVDGFQAAAGPSAEIAITVTVPKQSVAIE